MSFILARAHTREKVSVVLLDYLLGVQLFFSAKPIASIGTGLLEEYWVRRCTREFWWTLRLQASSSPRFACFARLDPSAYTYIISSAVAGKAEFPG